MSSGQEVVPFLLGGQMRHGRSLGLVGRGHPGARLLVSDSLDACAMHVGLLARRALERAIPIKAGVDVVLVVLARNRAADRALPAISEATALQAERRHVRRHQSVRAAGPRAGRAHPPRRSPSPSRWGPVPDRVEVVRIVIGERHEQPQDRGYGGTHPRPELAPPHAVRHEEQDRHARRRDEPRDRDVQVTDVVIERRAESRIASLPRRPAPGIPSSRTRP